MAADKSSPSPNRTVVGDAMTIGHLQKGLTVGHIQNGLTTGHLQQPLDGGQTSPQQPPAPAPKVPQK